VARAYTHHEVESAVAISGDLHSHLEFDMLVARHDRLRAASERWQLCIRASLELEDAAQHADVVWGETHDYYLAIEAIVDEIVHQEELNVAEAIGAALCRSRSQMR
jgi:hypothetical protein